MMESKSFSFPMKDDHYYLSDDNKLYMCGYVSADGFAMRHVTSGLWYSYSMIIKHIFREYNP